MAATVNPLSYVMVQGMNNRGQKEGLHINGNVVLGNKAKKNSSSSKDEATKLGVWQEFLESLQVVWGVDFGAGLDASPKPTGPTAKSKAWVEPGGLVEHLPMKKNLWVQLATCFITGGIHLIVITMDLRVAETTHSLNDNCEHFGRLDNFDAVERKLENRHRFWVKLDVQHRIKLALEKH